MRENALLLRMGTGDCSAAALLLFFHTVWGRGKGGYSLSRKRISPLHPQEKGRGEYPSSPDIGRFWLEELHALRNVSAVYMASP